MNRSGRESWGAPQGSKDNLSAVKQREQEKLKDVINKTDAGKDEAGVEMWGSLQAGVLGDGWVMAGCCRDVSQQRKETDFTARCKCLNTYQLRTKKDVIQSQWY